MESQERESPILSPRGPRVDTKGSPPPAATRGSTRKTLTTLKTSVINRNLPQPPTATQLLFWFEGPRSPGQVQTQDLTSFLWRRPVGSETGS